MPPSGLRPNRGRSQFRLRDNRHLQVFIVPAPKGPIMPVPMDYDDEPTESKEYPAEVLQRYRKEVLRALRARLIDGEDALELLISPSERVLEMMAKEAA